MIQDQDKKKIATIDLWWPNGPFFKKPYVHALLKYFETKNKNWPEMINF